MNHLLTGMILQVRDYDYEAHLCPFIRPKWGPYFNELALGGALDPHETRDDHD